MSDKNTNIITTQILTQSKYQLITTFLSHNTPRKNALSTEMLNGLNNSKRNEREKNEWNVIPSAFQFMRLINMASEQLKYRVDFDYSRKVGNAVPLSRVFQPSIVYQIIVDWSKNARVDSGYL